MGGSIGSARKSVKLIVLFGKKINFVTFIVYAQIDELIVFIINAFEFLFAFLVMKF